MTFHRMVGSFKNIHYYYSILSNTKVFHSRTDDEEELLSAIPSVLKSKYKNRFNHHDYLVLDETAYTMVKLINITAAEYMSKYEYSVCLLGFGTSDELFAHIDDMIGDDIVCGTQVTLNTGRRLRKFEEYLFGYKPLIKNDFNGSAPVTQYLIRYLRGLSEPIPESKYDILVSNSDSAELKEVYSILRSGRTVSP